MTLTLFTLGQEVHKMQINSLLTKKHLVNLNRIPVQDFDTLSGILKTAAQESDLLSPAHGVQVDIELSQIANLAKAGIVLGNQDTYLEIK